MAEIVAGCPADVLTVLLLVGVVGLGAVAIFTGMMVDKKRKAKKARGKQQEASGPGVAT